MMHSTKQARSTLLSMIMAGALGVGFATGASAQVGVGADAEVAPRGGQAGGSAETRMSPSGSENSNAQWGADPTRGSERAEERRSDRGMEGRGMEGGAAGGMTPTTPR